MDIITKKEFVLTMGVKPCKTPSDIPEKDDLRKEIPLRVSCNIKDVEKDFDLSKVPAVILSRFEKSVKIEIQKLYRLTPTNDTEKYAELYKKVQAICSKPQTYTVELLPERKAGGKSKETLRLEMQETMMAKQSYLGK